jgi:hypothetical protein
MHRDGSKLRIGEGELLTGTGRAIPGGYPCLKAASIKPLRPTVFLIIGRCYFLSCKLDLHCGSRDLFAPSLAMPRSDPDNFIAFWICSEVLPVTALQPEFTGKNSGSPCCRLDP